MRSVLALLLLATPAIADDRMTGAEFEAHVEGRTITFRSGLNPLYGVERYLPGRRVMWSSEEGICQYGVWFESKGDICFRYEHDPEHKCWAITMEPEGMRVEFTTRPGTLTIFEVPDVETPLICNDLAS
ncbi:MAG: hypothetical protein AAFU41_08030 [Pseudomonadota bacterium]